MVESRVCGKSTDDSVRKVTSRKKGKTVNVRQAVFYSVSPNLNTFLIQTELRSCVAYQRCPAASLEEKKSARRSLWRAGLNEPFCYASSYQPSPYPLALQRTHMSEQQHNYVADVRKYDAQPDEAAVSGIVAHLGIALHTRDASLVAAGDPLELARVRDGFLKKKLALTDTDAVFDAAISEVMTAMKGVRDKSRVTVCYLLAKKFGKLETFHAKK